MKKKYGFVYIWKDRKYNRCYIGCHWGREDDRYICSSSWMNSSYKKRPKDFKRRILSRIYTNKKELLEIEYRWLQMIKPEELKVKYYNLHNHHFNHWSANPQKYRTMSQKMMGNKIGLGRPCSKETRRKISQAQIGKIISEETKEKMRKSAKNRKRRSQEHIEKHAAMLRGKKRPAYIGKKVSETKKRNNAIKRAMLGYVISPETRKKISNSQKIRLQLNKEM